MSREIRYDNALGTLGAALGATSTAFTFQGVPPFATLANGDWIKMILEPPIGAPSANYEVVYITAYTAGEATATIERGQEDTTQVAHNGGTYWVCGPTAADFSLYVPQSEVGANGGIATLDGSGRLVQTEGLDLSLVLTLPKSAAYSAQLQDAIPVDLSTGNVPIRLPTAPADGTRVQVKVVKVNATPGTYVCTVNCGGTDVIDVVGGATGLTLVTLDQGVTLKYNAVQGIWLAESDPGQILSCALQGLGTLSVGTVYQPNLARPTFITQPVSGVGELHVLVGPTNPPSGFPVAQCSFTSNDVGTLAFIVPPAYYFMFTKYPGGGTALSPVDGPTYVTL